MSTDENKAQGPVKPDSADLSDGNGDDNKQAAVVVKSRAVVKYSNAPPACSYAVLQEQTDLKLPPANWLRESQLGPAGAGVLGSKTKPFSSFGMAYDFIDCIGDDVDVVSDSENIKKLLKIPYSKSHVSLAVHRVGRTLLLDELDVQELFMRSSQTGDWSWLKEFYQRLIDQKWQRKKKRQEHWYQKAILSKFLYYSINGDGAAEPVSEGEDGEEDHGKVEDCVSWPAHFTNPVPHSGEHTPDTEGAAGFPFALADVASDVANADDVASAPKENNQNLPTLFDEGESSQGLRNDFVRNIMWTFEDIHMLVGSNMPIFGGGRYPAVSLRLRDNNKPINILTGMDYWLDNLMCNVPELLMCFHVNGIVQKYEMIKTEDIPDLENSTFSTRVVKDIAQNILSFLKANCTKEGHTYWLFKASGSDIVKLYDLTTLCEEATEEKCQNPFTLPVAVLLYRVASNMMLKNQNRKYYGTIRTLLLNCLKLLDEDRHPQMMASANYMLAELFQLDEEGGACEEGGVASEDSYSEEEDEDEKEDREEEEEGERREEAKRREEKEEKRREEEKKKGAVGGSADDSKAIAIIKSVGELSVPEKYTSTSHTRSSSVLPVSQDKEERCRHVLNYVLKGLKVIDSSIKREGELPAADPHTPIPLKYTHTPQSSAQDTHTHISKLLDTGVCVTRSGMTVGSWQHRLKLQLIMKASRAFYQLASAANDLHKYGRALRYIKLALQCHDAYCSISTGSLSGRVLLFHSQCLCLCGDLQLMLASSSAHRPAHLEEYTYQTQEDQELLHCLHRESSCQAFSVATDLSSDSEFQLLVSSKCYEAAHDLLTSDPLSSGTLAEVAEQQATHTRRRLGNIRNELGVFYMNQAASLQTEKEGRKGVCVAEQDVWKRSFSYFEKGLCDFTAITDPPNAALLLCNMGRLMRVCAQAHSQSDDGSHREFSPEEALYYNKAVDYYTRALSALATRGTHASVWDSVHWELSTTYFTLATLLQDHAPLSRKAQEQVEREVTEAMLKSLRFCDLETPSPRQPLYQYRAATIHHRLASMYHSCYRNQVGSEALRKQHRQEAELHYSRASAIFITIGHAPCELLRTLLERVAFIQFTTSGQSSAAVKLKTLTGAMEVMCETHHAFTKIHTQLQEMPLEDADGADSAPDLDREEVMRLIAVFEPALSFLLLNIIKLSTKRKSSGPEEEGVCVYRQVYSSVLRADKEAPLTERIALYLQLLEQLNTNTHTTLTHTKDT
ncbi:erythroid differentiation-related factor 1 [Engraulis encrasicolus]|uniref:erythroid differentiation-related factor 1 n=1 Tax=Engraulis encrasicolus TaxID=184585 RepID=UPI002FCFDABA